jgi:Ca-activated chloride channel homolog
VKKITHLSAITILLLSISVQIYGSQDPVTIPSGQKFIMQLETPLHTRTTREGDKVEFTTAADVIVNNEALIPNKSLVRGTVIKSKRAGRISGRAEIQIRFDSVKIADGTLLPIKATITRMGFDPVEPKAGEDPKLKGEAGSGADAKTVARTSAEGAVIGVLTGGAKGAMYGAAAGAAIAAIGMALKRGPDLDLPRSTMFEAQFDKPVEVPASAMQARTAPLETPAAETQVADSSPKEAKSGTPPVLIDVGGGQSSEETSAPQPEVVTAGSPVEAPAKAGAESLPSVPAVATIKVKVRMVQVDAVVKDRAGHMIDNLKVDDFRIFEDGIPQEIQGYSRDELPLAVAFVIDRSESVAPYISELRRIAGQALNQLKPQDEVCLFSFADTVQRVEDLTADRRRIAAGLDRIRAGGATDITDALHDAINYLTRTAPGLRHAIILISDNKQTVNPQAGEGETIKLAMESETVVYSLRTAGDSVPLGAQIPSILFSGRGPVGKIAQETGGEVIDVRNSSALDSALGSVISRLRMRYSLSYYPTSASQGGAFHTITVRLTDSHGKPGSDYIMHAKRGYYATSGSSTTTSTYPASKQFL